MTYHLPAAWFSGCTTGAPSQVDVDLPEPQEVLAKKPAYTFVDNVSRAAIAPFRLWLPVTGGGWSAAGYLCSVLCSVRFWLGLAFRVVVIPQSGLLAQIRSLR